MYIRYFLSDRALRLRYFHFEKEFVHKNLQVENFVLITDKRNQSSIPNLKITDYIFSTVILDDTLKSKKKEQ